MRRVRAGLNGVDKADAELLLRLAILGVAVFAALAWCGVSLGFGVRLFRALAGV